MLTTKVKIGSGPLVFDLMAWLVLDAALGQFRKLVHDHERCENSQFHQDFSLFWDDLANSS